MDSSNSRSTDVSIHVREVDTAFYLEGEADGPREPLVSFRVLGSCSVHAEGSETHGSMHYRQSVATGFLRIEDARELYYQLGAALEEVCQTCGGWRVVAVDIGGGNEEDRGCPVCYVAPPAKDDL